MAKANPSTQSLGTAAHAAKRAADVVYVLQNKDQLDYGTLMRQLYKTLQRYGEQGVIMTDVDLDELKEAARELHAIFAAQDTQEAAGRLNETLIKYAHIPRLSMHDGAAWHIHVDSSDDAPWAEWFAASSALALATLLAEKQRKPGGICALPGCGRPFVDLGKGGGRMYCSVQHATRERVAAYRKKTSK